jgi:hypothetical protein
MRENIIGAKTQQDFVWSSEKLLEEKNLPLDKKEKSLRPR